MEQITSKTNPLCVHLRKLASSRSYREETGEFLCDSPKLLREAALWGVPIQALFPSGGPPERLEPDARGRMRYLVLDGVQDPGNVGTILRTADAFGAAVILLPGCADLYNPKTVRAGMGVHFRSVLHRCTLEELTALLKAADLPLYGAALREDTADVREVDLGRCAMAVGSEGRGLSAAVLAVCDRTIRIPMDPRCESLNAASAASVLLWEAARGEI